MEVNEAPEKIFLEWYRIGDEKYRDWCIMPKTNDEPVEYTRTNVLIEKACEFLKSYRQDTCDGLGYIAGIVNDETIEDFKKYMKGE